MTKAVSRQHAQSGRHCSCRTRVSSIGFTLIEVVMAMSILALILGTAYSSVTQILNVKTVLDDKRDVTILANSLIRRLTRELQLAVEDQSILFRNATSRASTTPTYFLGVSEGSGARNATDSVTFVAQEAGQYLPDGGTHTGMVQITYRVDQDPESNDRSSYVLVREEIPYVEPSGSSTDSFNKAKDKAFSQAMIFPVTESLRSFRLRYYDDENEEWRSEWDHTQRQTVPALIELTFSVASPRGTVHEYRTIVPVAAGIEKKT